MRRYSLSIIISCILSLILCFTVSAVQIDPSATRGMTINAIFGVFHDISITPVEHDGLSGMPFDIMGSDVWYQTGNPKNGFGRLIATWSLAMNGTSRRLTINATSLKCVKDADGNSVSNGTEICYWIGFALNYHRRSDDTIQDFYIGVYGNGTPVDFGNGDGKFDNIVESDNLPFVSQNQAVRIFLMKDSGVGYTQQERQAWMSGIYEATVTLTISGS